MTPVEFNIENEQWKTVEGLLNSTDCLSAQFIMAVYKLVAHATNAKDEEAQEVCKARFNEFRTTYTKRIVVFNPDFIGEIYTQIYLGATEYWKAEKAKNESDKSNKVSP